MISPSQDIVLNSLDTEVLQSKSVELKDLNRKMILSAVIAVLGMIIILIGVGLILFSGTTPLALSASLIVLGIALFLCGFVLSLQFYRCEKLVKRQLKVAVSLVNPQDVLKRLDQNTKDIETGVDSLYRQSPTMKNFLEPAFNGALGELRRVLQQKQILLNTYIEQGSLLNDETLKAFQEDVNNLGSLVSHFLDLVRLNRAVLVSQKEIEAYCFERNILGEDQEAVFEPFTLLQDKIIKLSLHSLGMDVAAWNPGLFEETRSLGALIEQEITSNMERLCGVFKELDCLKEGGLERFRIDLNKIGDRLSVLMPTVAGAVKVRLAENNLRRVLDACRGYQCHLSEQRQDNTTSLVVENNRILKNWRDFVAVADRDSEGEETRLFPGRKRLFQEFQHMGTLFREEFHIDGTREDVVSASDNKIEEAAARRSIFDIQCLEQATDYEEFLTVLDAIARNLTEHRISQRLDTLLQDVAECLPSCLNLLNFSEERPSDEEEERVLGILQKLGLDHYIPYPIRVRGESRVDYIRKQVGALLALISDLTTQELARQELSRRWLGELKSRLGRLIDSKRDFDRGSGHLLNVLQTLKKEKAQSLKEAPTGLLKESINRLECQTASFERVADFREQKIRLTADIGSASKAEEGAVSLVRRLQNNEALWENRVEVEKEIAATSRELQMTLVREHAARQEMEKEIESNTDPVTGVLSERGVLLKKWLLESEQQSADLMERGRSLQAKLAAERAAGYPGELMSKVVIDYRRKEVEQARKLHREAQGRYSALFSSMEKERDCWPVPEEFNWLTGSNLLVDADADNKDGMQEFSETYLKMNEMGRFIVRARQALMMKEEENRAGEIWNSCGKLLSVRENSSWERATGRRDEIVAVRQQLEVSLGESVRLLGHLRSLGCPVITLELSERISNMEADLRDLREMCKVLFPESDPLSTIDIPVAAELEVDVISQEGTED